MLATIMNREVIPLHVLHERDQMPHQCTPHEHLVQVPGIRLKKNKELRHLEIDNQSMHPKKKNSTINIRGH